MKSDKKSLYKLSQERKALIGKYLKTGDDSILYDIHGLSHEYENQLLSMKKRKRFENRDSK